MEARCKTLTVQNIAQNVLHTHSERFKNCFRIGHNRLNICFPKGI